MSVSVCVCTFRRPRGLARLLEALARVSAERLQGELEVVVVDNDPEGSARETVAALAPSLPWPVRYVPEPRRGISFARNRAVAEAGAEWIAFLDDDEEPEPGWLDELLRVQAGHAADVVAGPVMPRFEAPVPRWIERGRFFEVPRHATGTRLPYADTGNVLVRASVFRALGGAEGPFSARLALAGGEDTHFFLRVARAGHRIVWADDALAWEWVPPSRTRVSWLLRRAFRRGNTWALCERELDPAFRVRALRLARAVGRIGVGTLRMLAAPFSGTHAAVDALRGICFGAGSVAGLAGFRYDEYRTTHGA
ncbi:MAG TPA: glycosyltransferase family 2 protein [Longimicrobium sp.]|jgi:glycosyltransferase involved in cell wall biosynthesis